MNASSIQQQSPPSSLQSPSSSSQSSSPPMPTLHRQCKHSNAKWIVGLNNKGAASLLTGHHEISLELFLHALKGCSSIYAAADANVDPPVSKGRQGEQQQPNPVDIDRYMDKKYFEEDNNQSENDDHFGHDRIDEDVADDNMGFDNESSSSKACYPRQRTARDGARSSSRFADELESTLRTPSRPRACANPTIHQSHHRALRRR